MKTLSMSGLEPNFGEGDSYFTALRAKKKAEAEHYQKKVELSFDEEKVGKGVSEFFATQLPAGRKIDKAKNPTDFMAVNAAFDDDDPRKALMPVVKQNYQALLRNKELKGVEPNEILNYAYESTVKETPSSKLEGASFEDDIHRYRYKEATKPFGMGKDVVAAPGYDEWLAKEKARPMEDREMGFGEMAAWNLGLMGAGRVLKKPVSNALGRGLLATGVAGRVATVGNFLTKVGPPQAKLVGAALAAVALAVPESLAWNAVAKSDWYRAREDQPIMRDLAAMTVTGLVGGGAAKVGGKQVLGALKGGAERGLVSEATLKTFLKDSTAEHVMQVGAARQAEKKALGKISDVFNKASATGEERKAWFEKLSHSDNDFTQTGRFGQTKYTDEDALKGVIQGKVSHAEDFMRDRRTLVPYSGGKNVPAMNSPQTIWVDDTGADPLFDRTLPEPRLALPGQQALRGADNAALTGEGQGFLPAGGPGQLALPPSGVFGPRGNWGTFVPEPPAGGPPSGGAGGGGIFGLKAKDVPTLEVVAKTPEGQSIFGIPKKAQEKIFTSLDTDEAALVVDRVTEGRPLSDVLFGMQQTRALKAALSNTEKKIEVLSAKTTILPPDNVTGYVGSEAAAEAGKSGKILALTQEVAEAKGELVARKAAETQAIKDIAKATKKDLTDVAYGHEGQALLRDVNDPRMKEITFFDEGKTPKELDDDAAYLLEFFGAKMRTNNVAFPAMSPARAARAEAGITGVAKPRPKKGAPKPAVKASEQAVVDPITAEPDFIQVYTGKQTQSSYIQKIVEDPKYGDPSFSYTALESKRIYNMAAAKGLTDAQVPNTQIFKDFKAAQEKAHFIRGEVLDDVVDDMSELGGNSIIKANHVAPVQEAVAPMQVVEKVAAHPAKGQTELTLLDRNIAKLNEVIKKHGKNSAEANAARKVVDANKSALKTPDFVPYKSVDYDTSAAVAKADAEWRNAVDVLPKDSPKLAEYAAAREDALKAYNEQMLKNEEAFVKAGGYGPEVAAPKVTPTAAPVAGDVTKETQAVVGWIEQNKGNYSALKDMRQVVGTTNPEVAARIDAAMIQSGKSGLDRKSAIRAFMNQIGKEGMENGDLDAYKKTIKALLPNSPATEALKAIIPITSVGLITVASAIGVTAEDAEAAGMATLLKNVKAIPKAWFNTVKELAHVKGITPKEEAAKLVTLIKDMEKQGFVIKEVGTSKVLPPRAKVPNYPSLAKELYGSLEAAVNRGASELWLGFERIMSPYSRAQLHYKVGANPMVHLAHTQAMWNGNADNAFQVFGNIMRDVKGGESAARDVIKMFEPLAKKYSGVVETHNVLTVKIKQGEKAIDALEKGIAKGKVLPEDLAKVQAKKEALGVELKKYKDALVKADPEFQQYLKDHDVLLKDAAKKYPSTRVFLAAEDTDDLVNYPWLKGMLTVEEKQAVTHVKAMMKSYEESIVEQGMNVMTNRPFMHYSWHPEWHEARAAKYAESIGIDLPITTIPYNRFHSRTLNARPLVPDAWHSVQSYVPMAEKTLGVNAFWNAKGPKGESWAKHMRSSTVQNDPKLRAMWNSINDALLPMKQTEVDKWANRYFQFEVFRLLAGSPSVAYKHLFKLVGTYSSAGIRESGAHAGQAATATWRKWMNNPELKSLAQKAGINTTTEKKFYDDVLRTYTYQARRSNILDDYDLLPPSQIGWFDNMFQNLNHHAGFMTSAVESFDRSHQFLTSAAMAAKRGLTGRDASYAIFDGILKDNFLGGVMNPSWAKSSTVRAMMLFQTTAFKIMERRLITGIQTKRAISDVFTSLREAKAAGHKWTYESVMQEMKSLKDFIIKGEYEFKSGMITDSLATQRDFLGQFSARQAMRELVYAGVILGGGSAMGHDYAHHLNHFPFLGKSQDGEPLVGLSPIARGVWDTTQGKVYGGEESDFGLPGNFLKNWLKQQGPVPQMVSKAVKASRDDIPEIYREEGFLPREFRYFFAIPSTKEKE